MSGMTSDPVTQALRRRRRRVNGGAILVGCVVAVVHQLALFMAWTNWNAIPRAGQPASMPWQWPILAFPLFPLYDLLSGHDRTMLHSFWWLMLGNSALWGITAGILARAWLKRRSSGDIYIPVPWSAHDLEKYPCGVNAGDQLKLLKEIVVRDSDGKPTGKVYAAGGLWGVIKGLSYEPSVVWLVQPDEEMGTWDDESLLSWFEVVSY